jgi:predicted lipid-binding transport protein (Tim44 family)
LDAIFNAQVGMAFGIIVLLLVIYVVVIGWMRRLGDPSKTTPAQPGPPGADGAPVVRAEAQSAASAAEASRKKKQLLIQGKDAEIAANVLRRMLSDHDKA